jgi:uracil-DNA glycosylase
MNVTLNEILFRHILFQRNSTALEVLGHRNLHPFPPNPKIENSEREREREREREEISIINIWHIIFLIGNLHEHFTRMNPKPYPPSHSFFDK